VKRRAMADVDVAVVADAIAAFDPAAPATATELTDDTDLRERELELQ
jgi:hypothetical protein